MNRKNEMVVPTQRQLEILTGTLLGDGHLRRNLSGTVNGKIEHGKNQREYLEWKYEQLNNLVNPIIKNNSKDKRIGDDFRRESYSFTIKANPALESLYLSLYKNGVKYISKELLNNYTILSLAVHFMDDGYKCFRQYQLCTDNFTIDDIDLLRNHLLNNIGLKTSVLYRGFRKDDTPAYRINILNRYAGLFDYLVKPYILPSLQYKLSVS